MTGFAPPTKTVNDVFRQVKRKFGDESGVQLEETDLLMWVNDATRVIATENKVIRVRATTPIVSGQSEYQLSSLDQPVYQIDSLLIDGARIPNMATAQAEDFISENDAGGTEQGFPQFWYEWAGVITFWPKPNAAGTLTVRYVAYPAAVTLTTDILPVPDSYFQDVVNYVLKSAYEMDENEGMMRVKAEEFQTSLDKRGEEQRVAQHMTYEVITVYDPFD